MGRTTKTAARVLPAKAASELVTKADQSLVLHGEAVANHDPAESVAKLLRVATEDVLSAVDAITGLKADEITDVHRDFAREHGGVVYAASTDAESRKLKADETVKRLDGELTTAREELKRSRETEAIRTKSAVRFTYRSLKVLGIFPTARALCQAYGLSEGYVSRMVLAGEAMDTGNTTSAKSAVAFMAAARDNRKALVTAVKAEGATLATIKEAIAAAPAKRQAEEQARADAETTDVDANATGLQFAALLVQLTKTKTRIADSDAATGTDVIRHVNAAIKSYREMVAVLDTKARAKADRAVKRAVTNARPTPPVKADVLDGVRVENAS